MLAKFRQWYLRNQKEITWFLTGWLSLSAFQALARGNYFDAALCVAFVALNVSLDRK